jgi:hypothetical protein
MAFANFSAWRERRRANAHTRRATRIASQAPLSDPAE